nr:hypothetical protein [Tanacetum cinerariifolium]
MNFIYTKDDEDLSFLPNEPSSGFGTGFLYVSIKIEPLKANEEPVIQPVVVTAYSRESLKPELFVVNPKSVAARMKDKKCKTREGSSRPPVKRKLAPGSSSSRATRAKTSSSKENAPFLIVSDDDEGLPDEECEGLRVKYEAAMTEFEKNPSMVALHEKISSLSIEVKEHNLNLNKMILESQKWAVEVSLRKEVGELKQDRREVVSKVVPNVAIELDHSDEMGSLVGRLVSFAILYGRYRAYEQVADMKEPFDFSKVKGYRSSYKKDHTQANKDFATATFPWLDKFVADPSTPIEVLLSKKPPSLQRPVPSKT